MNTAQKMAIQSSTKQNGEATTEEVPGSIVPYTEEEINTFKEDMAPENTKKSTPPAIVYVCMYVNLYLNTGNHQLSLT